MKSAVVWREGMAFNGSLEGFDVPLDASPAFGGVGHGPKPKGLILTALAGCTAMDVISILRKMRITPDTFSVDAEGELATEHPRVFTEIVLHYRFEGEELPLAKLRKAITLSETRYCPVNAMLAPSTPIRSELWVNGHRQDLEAAA